MQSLLVPHSLVAYIFVRSAEPEFSFVAKTWSKFKSDKQQIHFGQRVGKVSRTFDPIRIKENFRGEGGRRLRLLIKPTIFSQANRSTSSSVDGSTYYHGSFGCNNHRHVVKLFVVVSIFFYGRATLLPRRNL